MERGREHCWKGFELKGEGKRSTVDHLSTTSISGACYNLLPPLASPTSDSSQSLLLPWERKTRKRHEEKLCTPAVEYEIITALSHLSCEIGLVWHYMFSPPDVQQQVSAQQLRIAVDRGICIMDHTWEVHGFTDTVAFGFCLLEYFPNLHIGVTGIVCYATNLNAAELLKQMSVVNNKRILLETDAPYMVLANVYGPLEPKQSRLPFAFVDDSLDS
ncbi:hypothetical protein EDD18DRAFT_1098001 [Armillaria luteobubalina]|uniref:Uncharacterized protein n=1 Tax=Armillaria luteobubalina TaxID=153913 RepID=A0AA39QPH0_9AGAR|nr:hypothetical protein EDD18DRAFT_1098001 [Armillaria luteobubalina]